MANASALEFPEQYRVELWTRDRGLPGNEVRAVLQSRDGYIWAATRSGVARFDGVRFSVFSPPNTRAMAVEDCRALVQDRKGTVWVGTDGGLSRLWLAFNQGIGRVAPEALDDVAEGRAPVGLRGLRRDRRDAQRRDQRPKEPTGDRSDGGWPTLVPNRQRRRRV